MFSGDVEAPQQIFELIKALARIRGEASGLARVAQSAIERRLFNPYRMFRSKIEEHEALVSVVKSRLNGRKDRHGFGAAVTTEERLRLELLVQASLRFFYALSASTILPIGARETFIGELQSLSAIRERLNAPEHAGTLPDGLLDDLETAQLILEEIAEKAPQLADFGRPRNAE